MAPKKKKVPTCQFFCLKSLQKALNNYIKNATEGCQKQNQDFGTLSILEHNVEENVRTVQQYLFQSTPICLCSKLAETFLKALKQWLSVNISNEITELTDSMYVALRLSEVIANHTIGNSPITYAHYTYNSSKNYSQKFREINVIIFTVWKSKVKRDHVQKFRQNAHLNSAKSAFRNSWFSFF